MDYNWPVVRMIVAGLMADKFSNYPFENDADREKFQTFLGEQLRERYAAIVNVEGEWFDLESYASNLYDEYINGPRPRMEPGAVLVDDRGETYFIVRGLKDGAFIEGMYINDYQFSLTSYSPEQLFRQFKLVDGVPDKLTEFIGNEIENHQERIKIFARDMAVLKELGIVKEDTNEG